jgi:hypothetical protein
MYKIMGHKAINKDAVLNTIKEAIENGVTPKQAIRSAAIAIETNHYSSKEEQMTALVQRQIDMIRNGRTDEQIAIDAEKYKQRKLEEATKLLESNGYSVYSQEYTHGIKEHIAEKDNTIEDLVREQEVIETKLLIANEKIKVLDSIIKAMIKQ